MIKNRACVGCHQLGQLSTRTIPAAFGEFKSGEDAWRRRTMSGQAAPLMINPLAGYLGGAPYKYFGEWTDRVAKGELPHAKPPRPQGVERNVVVTTWDWGNEKQYLHDLISSDRRNPTVNANGKLFGSPEYATDVLPILDPKTNTVTNFKAPVQRSEDAGIARARVMPRSSSQSRRRPIGARRRSGTAGSTITTRCSTAKDGCGSRRRSAVPTIPDFCKKGSEHPSAKAFPIEKNVRQVSILDPQTMKYTFVDTCFGSHHLQFDAKDRVWTSGAGGIAGWVDMKIFDETGDAAKAQGWSPFVLDTNGNGKRDEYTEPNQPADAAKDARITGGSGTYAVMPNPADGSIWYTVGVFAGRGGVMRYDPDTQLAEVFNVPMPGFGPRGGDIDSKGVVWVSLASGHIGSFDRSKCKAPLNGPKATGDHCPEGWAFYQYPGPGFQGIGENSAEASYYSWVDQHDTLGLGKDVPISTANLQDGFAALKDGKMVLLRVPYPLGFYAKGLDGRIDDPNGGWKGRGMWSSSGDRTPWLIEGGKGRLPMAVHFQVRPDPLAK